MDDPATQVPTSTPSFGALILAGGRSARMGRDKASLPYKGTTLLAHIQDVLARAGATPILVGGGLYGDLDDLVAGAGPIGSLCALARHTAGLDGRWLIAPVDMPLLQPDLIWRLVRGPRHACFTGHPLPAVLTMADDARAVMEEALARLKAGKSVAVHQVLAQLGAEALAPDPREQAQLINVNTPDEWARIE